jgi:feruloyl esterase
MFLWNWAALHQEPGSALSPAQVGLVSNAVIKARSARDGGAPSDDFLTDPRMCNFNPAKLLKPPGRAAPADYLTRAQVSALQKIYAGPTNPRTGERIYTPPPVGSERTIGLTLPADPKLPPPRSYLFRWVFGAGFDYTQFDFDRDLDKMDARLAPILNANNPDLSGLRRRGGKILMYTGTADAVTPFQDALNYYERVVQSQGGLAETQEFFRYFLVPGLGHAAGGPGLNDFGQRLILDVPQDCEHDAFMALVKWVEQGVAPDKIIATAFKGGDPTNGIRFQRPIYPYPKFAHYIGGDVNSPSSYEGVDHPRGHVLPPAERYLN